MQIAGIIYGAGRPPFEGTVVVDGARIAAIEEGVSRAPGTLDLRPACLVP